VNYDNSLVVTITVTCYSWVPSSGDHLFTCGAIFWPPHFVSQNARNMWRRNLSVSADAQCQNKKNVVKLVSGR